MRAWSQADINQFNKKGLRIPCPYCGSHGSDFVHRWVIDHPDHLGLFDRDAKRLRIIYGSELKRVLPKRACAEYTERALNSLRGVSHVDYWRCPSCDLVFQNFPHDTGSKEFYYREIYRIRHNQKDQKLGVYLYGRDDERWVYQQELIGRYFLEATRLKRPAQILDVGCGEGLVVKYLESKGIDAFGLEPSEPMANYARYRLGVRNIVCGSYASDVYPENFFEGIVSHHVVEHVVDIKGFFSALARHLKPSGYLLLQAPCMDNLKTKEDHDKILSGGHLYAYSEKFLRDALAAVHFEIMECRKTPCDFSELEPEYQDLWDTSTWGDDPCGISILGRKR
jgi:SAM-dependent methyltransferase